MLGILLQTITAQHQTKNKTTFMKKLYAEDLQSEHYQMFGQQHWDLK